MPNRPKDFSTEASAPHSDDFIMVDGATNATRKLAPAKWLGAHRNALAPRGGVAFDGTSGTKAKCSLTGQLIGADNFSVTLAFKVPTVNPASNAVLCEISSAIGAGDQANSVLAYIETSGRLRFLMYGDTTVANYRDTPSLTITSSHAGKVAHLVFGRNAAGLFCFINGVAQTFGTDATGGTPPTWATTSVTSTYFYVGAASGTIFAGTIYSATLYNCALAQADVTEIYELGGAVPERFKFGSQGNFMAGNDATFAGAGNWVATGTATATASGGQLVVAGMAFAGVGAFTSPTWMQSSFAAKTPNRRYRVTFDVVSLSLTSGNTGVNVNVPIISSAIIGTVTTTGAKSYDFDYVSGGSDGQQMLVFGCAASGGASITIDNAVIKTIGAVVHYDADLDGLGYQLHDQSTNKLDAVLTHFGVSWTKPARRGYVRGTQTWAGTHETKWLTGATRDIPSEAVITRITTKATVATTGAGVSVGSNNTSNRYVAANALTTAKKNHALATTLPASVSDGDCTLAVDPTDAAYTGSITTEVHYAVTEGSP